MTLCTPTHNVTIHQTVLVVGYLMLRLACSIHYRVPNVVTLSVEVQISSNTFFFFQSIFINSFIKKLLNIYILSLNHTSQSKSKIFESFRSLRNNHFKHYKYTNMFWSVLTLKICYWLKSKRLSCKEIYLK